MEKTFKKYRMLCLMSFSVMYSFVYLGRFNVNNLMTYISEDISIGSQQQNIISVSVFITYALGSFINGYIADKYGAKKIVIIGGVVTSVLNMSIALQSSWYTILMTWICNGYFQSMIWVGGISILSHWWKEGERGKGVGIANFFSGMSHTVAYLVPLMMVSLWPTLGWRWYFVIPIGILMVFVILFAIFAKETPEDVGLEPYECKSTRHQKGKIILQNWHHRENHHGIIFSASLSLYGGALSQCYPVYADMDFLTGFRIIMKLPTAEIF